MCVCVCSNSRKRRSPSGSAVRNHCRTHPAPCVRPRCVCSVLRAHAQFCRFDKADATADVQWHCNHRPPLWYHYFPAQSSLGADILVYWIGKIVRTCAPGGSRTLDFLHARQAPYPLGQALRLKAIWFMSTHIIGDKMVTSSIRIAEVFPELVGRKTRAIWKVYGGMLKYIIN